MVSGTRGVTCTSEMTGVIRITSVFVRLRCSHTEVRNILQPTFSFTGIYLLGNESVVEEVKKQQIRNTAYIGCKITNSMELSIT
jgi:hypothetical protein